MGLFCGVERPYVYLQRPTLQVLLGVELSGIGYEIFSSSLFGESYD